uniref:Multiple epidermal growth factor-like domains protein 11 isoform X2 n=1 Tax=Crassostrea virginica TaxID=6565 RepID=A0A8B8B044_CRAVI|nr:multiple epidermal growth factor-like domains protein 11 isoform X2 [Crassostrea virginica]
MDEVKEGWIHLMSGEMEIWILHILLGHLVINPINSISLPNIALGKDAYQSSTYNSITGAEKAVDGLKSNLSFSGGQCAVSASGEKTALWRVELGDVSSIQNITIYYRTENLFWNASNGFTEVFVGFYVYVSNTTNKDDGQLCFHDNEHFNPSTIPAVLTLNCTLQGRYVIYYNERTDGQPDYYFKYVGTHLCEFEVYGCQQGFYGDNCMSTCPDNCLSNLCELVTGNCFQCDAGYKGPRCDMECDSGMYGQDCGNTCGSCINNTQCHHVNGSCLQGCGPGYQGDKCTEECPSGKYGINCQHDCSSTCNALHSCNRTTGECIGGCEPGWKGFFCKQKCDGGMYGQDCVNTCGSCINNTQCHHVNGSCLQGCGPGYQGNECKEECPPGTYGHDCKHHCSVTCSVSNSCNRTSGECVGGCKPGWKGFLCKQECDGGMYGQDCGNTCGSCINDTQCHHINGTCLHVQGCGPGYKGDKCIEECSMGTYGNDCKYNCSSTCSVPQRCKKTTGECIGGCTSGWKGFMCERICDNGMYGEDCSKTCGFCFNNTQCHHVYGSCLQGCGSGYLGNKCTEVTSLMAKQQSCEHSIYISAGVLATIVIVGTILNLLIWKRKHQKLKNNSKNITNSHVLDKQEKTIPSTYAELGDIDKQHTYDDIHHYSEANNSK